jgi:hypothetical protein
MSPQPNPLFDSWKTTISAHQGEHYRSANKLEKWHYILGTLTVIFATIASATLFTELDDAKVKFWIGVIGVIAAVLAAIQTIVIFGKRAEQHRKAAAQLGGIRRQIEVIEQWPSSSKEAKQIAENINKQLSEIDNSAPILKIPQGIKPLSRFSADIGMLFDK